MRFTADGVDIPDELLWAQDEGRAVFFCGAGVSRAKAGLPDFDGLTSMVIDGLGAGPADEARKLFELAVAAKNADGIDGLSIADQIFQKLRRNFTDADIGAKVAECLRSPPETDLTAHKTLLQLGRIHTGETRIVTTNFDRLFERCNARLASVTRSHLPHLAFNKADWGIVHLHGCVKPDHSGPTADGFVLSSAEFGDAYLAMGWARDFVKGILDRYVAVFVGYSADDPPVRYLLEGLQQSNGPSNRAYAFQSGPDDRAVASWDEKGVEALLYPTDVGCGHRRLWETLGEWSRRSVDPLRWRNRVLAAAKKGPATMKPHERGMIAHIVSSPDGALSFAQHQPRISAEWLCVFDPLVRYGEPRSIDGPYSESAVVDPFDRYGLDRDPAPRPTNSHQNRNERGPKDVWSAFDPSPADLRELGSNQISNVRGYFARYNPYLPRRLGSIASWIATVADEPACVWWAGQQPYLHHEIRDRLRIDEDVKGDGRAARIVRDAWQAILEYHEHPATERDRAHSVRLKAGRTGWHETLSREYAAHFAPRLELNVRWRSPIPPQPQSKFARQDLVNLDVEYSKAILTVAVPDEYLSRLIGKLRYCIEFAEDLENRYRSYLEISSIEADEPGDEHSDNFSRSYKLSGHVIAFAGFFRRLSALDPKAAHAELKAWSRTSPVFERLRIWALGNLDFVPASEYADELLALSTEGFWPFRGERDLLLGLAKRWQDFARRHRVLLERRIRRGPSVQRDDANDLQRSAHWRLSRINWLNHKGCEFTFDLDKVNADLRKLAPEWKPEYAANAADSNDGKGGWVKTNTEFGELADLPPKEIIARVLEIERRPAGALIERDPFLGLSKEHPRVALAALLAKSSSEVFYATLWQTFLRIDVREKDERELSIEIAQALIGLDDKDFASILRSAGDWFEKWGPHVEEVSRQRFNALWNKFIAILMTDAQATKSSLIRKDRSPDWATESINSTAGRLAQLVADKPLEPVPEVGKGFPKPWLKRIEQLLALPGDARRYALVIVGFKLRWFFYIDPSWTNENVLAVLNDDSSSHEDRDAILAGFFWNAHVPQADLFIRLKSHLLRLARDRSEQRERHVEILAGILLSGWSAWKDGKADLISSDELRTLLIEGDPEFRHHIVWTLDRMSDGDEKSAGRLIEFLQEVWPRQKSIRTPQTSAALCELALSQKHHFAEIALLVSGLVSKVSDDRIFVPELRDAEETVALQHPEAMLRLLHAVLPDNRSRWPYGAEKALRTLAEAQPSIRGDPRYIELEGKPL